MATPSAHGGLDAFPCGSVEALIVDAGLAGGDTGLDRGHIAGGLFFGGTIVGGFFFGGTVICRLFGRTVVGRLFGGTVVGALLGR